MSSSSSSSSSSNDIKARLRIMEASCKDLILYIDHVNSLGGITKLDNLYEHAICDCVNRLGDSIKINDLGFDAASQYSWSGLRVITAHHYHRLDLSKVWVELPTAATNLLATIEAKLK